MTNALRPLPVDEFVRLAAHAGLEITRDDLEQLERRRLIQPYDSGSFSRLHLYLLATYFDAIRCFRHPWAMKQSSRTIDDVKKTATRVADVMATLQSEASVDETAAERIASLALDVERFLASIDPFGPIADFIDLLRKDVRGSLRGVGRLYSELHMTATALVETAEMFGAPVGMDNPTTREVPEDVLRETAEMTAEDLGFSSKPSQPEDAPEPEEVLEEISGSSEPDEVASEPEDEAAEAAPEEDEASEPSPAIAKSGELSEPSEPEELSEPSEPEELSEPSERAEFSEPSERAEFSEPSEPEELSEPSEPEELSEPSEPEELSEPSEPEELSEPSERAEFSEPSERAEFSEPSEPEELSEPSEPEELSEPSEPEELSEPSGPERSEPSQPMEERPTASADDDFEEFPSEDTELTEISEVDDEEESDEMLRSTLETDSGGLDNPSETEEIPPEKPDNPFAREESPSGRTQALLDRLEEIKAQRSGDDHEAEEEPPEEEASEEQPDPAELEEKVNELNLLREQLIRAQDWGGLVALYEERIDLFDAPVDRQQVFLTLATLYEVKLGDDDNAFRCFDAAFEIGVRDGQFKTLDSLRKIGRQDGLYDRYSTWLERQLPHATDGDVREQMQRDLAQAHQRDGHPQRAFLSYAAYLAQEPNARIDVGSLDFLDELSIQVDDAELAGFFEDILEHDAADEVKALVAIRAGTFYLGTNEPHHAIRHFRAAFDLQPSSDIAFSNLARLYEKEENWGDLRGLIAEKLKSAEGEEAERLRRELGRVVNQENASAKEKSP